MVDAHVVRDEVLEGLGVAVAQVVAGGNRLLRITAHVVCKDVNGQPRWAEDIPLVLPIPAGTEVPQFTCAAVTTEVVEHVD